MPQDGNSRTKNEWFLHKYDFANREVMLAVGSSKLTHEQLQGIFANSSNAINETMGRSNTIEYSLTEYKNSMGLLFLILMTEAYLK